VCATRTRRRGVAFLECALWLLCQSINRPSDEVGRFARDHRIQHRFGISTPVRDIARIQHRFGISVIVDADGRSAATLL